MTERRHYVWFEGDALHKIASYFQYGSKVARLEIRGHGKDTTLRFLDADGSLLGEVNDAHPCPPDCE